MPDNIWDLRNDFKVFIFDVYGVIWDGKKVVPEYDTLMRKLRESGKTVIILSNGTVLSEKAEATFAGRGFIKNIHYDRLVTSGAAAHEAFIQDSEAKKFYQFGRPNHDLFAGSKYEEVSDPREADFIYAGVPQIKEGEVWRDFLRMDVFRPELKRLAETGKPLICANPDRLAFENQFADPVVRQGSVADVFREYGGKVIFFGKPEASVYAYALQGIQASPEQMLMIGDTLETDIAGGKNYGMKTALTRGGIADYYLKRSGMSEMTVFARKCGIVPDYILQEIPSF